MLSETEKKPQHACDICEGVQSFNWLVELARSMVHDPIPSAAAARSYRRKFKETLRGAHSDAMRAELKRRWAQNVERMPWLSIAGGRPPEQLSGLVLYVLTAAISQILEHARDDFGNPGERKNHFERAGEFAREVYDAGKLLPDFDRGGSDRTIIARLLGVERKLIDLRLRPAQISAEIEAARKRGHVTWVHPNWVWQAANYRDDKRVMSLLQTQAA